MPSSPFRPASEPRIRWPSRYRWLHDHALAKPEAVHEYKPEWNAMLYRLHGKIFALLLRNRELGILFNLKCDPYLSLHYRQLHPTVLPGWHMNKLHWISLSLRGTTGQEICRELLDNSYALVLAGLPGKVRRRIAAGDEAVSGTGGIDTTE